MVAYISKWQHDFASILFSQNFDFAKFSEN